MKECTYILSGHPERVSGRKQLKKLLEAALEESDRRWKKVLLLGPDMSRIHSMAGDIINVLYHMLEPIQVDIMPALGTHVPMTQQECRQMYGDIPLDRFLVHNWRADVVKIGTVPAGYVSKVSEGCFCNEIDVEVNRHLFDDYDQIISVGQVVPHEVVGMANHSKNIFVGVGGHSMINSSHALGAFYGMERMMGRDHSPVRQVFDYAAEHFLWKLPLSYILTVVSVEEGAPVLQGLFVGKERARFEEAIKLSQKKNITYLEKAPKKIVAWMDGEEYHSTWIANKAIYRTRMAVADGGELIVLAPGVERFGEDPDIDRLIRRYGYRGKNYIMNWMEESEELKSNLSTVAHLIHGSSDDRFQIIYCTKQLTPSEICQAGFQWASYEEMYAKYHQDQTGWYQTADGEEYYYIDTPGLGLWSVREKMGGSV